MHSGAFASSVMVVGLENLNALTAGKPVWVVHETLLDLRMERGHALIVERHFAADQNVQHDAKTPYINLGAGILPSLQEFWSCKIKTSTECLQGATRREEVAEAKVDDLDIASFADENILDLEVSVDNAVLVAVVEGTRNLAAEFPSLFLLKFSMGNDVIKHLSSIHIFKEHIPMVVCSNHITQATNIRMVEQGDNGGFSGSADLLGVVISLFVASTLVGVVGRAPGNNFACDLQIRRVSMMQRMSSFNTMETKAETKLRKLACSLPSSFLASLTLPMLPAPMVFPRIHLPDCVGMVVRDLAFVAPLPPAARGSAVAAVAAEGCTGAGPTLWATVLAMSAVMCCMCGR